MTVQQNEQMTTVSIISGIALRGAFESTILPWFTRVSGLATQVRWGSTTALLDVIAGGQYSDVAVLTDVAIRRLTQDNVLDERNQAVVAHAELGIAVNQGDVLPDISTKDAFIDVLLRARSVAFSRDGASGIYFNNLINQLNIGDRIRERATIVPGGFTAEMLVNGMADIAVQQISELVMVPNVKIVGPLPQELQSITTFRAAVFKNAQNRCGAERLIQSLVMEEARTAYSSAGLTPE